jgi:hypothetical protein
MPTNNPPTSARHPTGVMTYAGLHGDMQNLGIKSPRANNRKPIKHKSGRASLDNGAFGSVSAIEYRDKRGTSRQYIPRDNPVPSAACNRKARGGEGRTSRETRKDEPPHETPAPHVGEDVLWTHQ